MKKLLLIALVFASLNATAQVCNSKTCIVLHYNNPLKADSEEICVVATINPVFENKVFNAALNSELPIPNYDESTSFGRCMNRKIIECSKSAYCGLHYSSFAVAYTAAWASQCAYEAIFGNQTIVPIRRL